MYIEKKSIIKTVIILTMIIILFFLIKANIIFSSYLCEVLEIPEDFHISVLSPGFKNEIFFLSTFIESLIIINLYCKINENWLVDDNI